jgi:hypothetical protein
MVNGYNHVSVISMEKFLYYDWVDDEYGILRMIDNFIYSTYLFGLATIFGILINGSTF